MITEQEAREASRIHEECSRKFFAGELFGIKAHDDYGRSGATLIEFAIQELARREAERVERAKPIDAEWLEAIGACDGGAWRYVQYDGGKVYIGRSMDVWVNASSVSAIRTRGQLLDLLAALKGGAT